MNETTGQADRSSLTRYAWLSMAAALVTIGLKTAAYLLTGSVGLLSDALESLVNLAGAIMALSMLRIAEQPEDEDHAYGHGKAEYFSSGVEGTLILIAAISIAGAAIQRLMHPRALEMVGLGLIVSVAASLVNLGVSLILMRAARRRNSVTLEANARHLMTDVWTSAGVVVGVGAVAVTGWQSLDPIVAIAVACNIVWVGGRIVYGSIHGLMDSALPAEEQAMLRNVLEAHVRDGIGYHAFRTRRSGTRRFVSLHVLVPGEWSVKKSHDLIERIEEDICKALPNLHVIIHFEPIEDPSSWDDVGLDRIGENHEGRRCEPPK